MSKKKTNKEIEQMHGAHYEVIVHVAAKARYISKLQDDIKELTKQLDMLEAEIDYAEGNAVIN